MSGGGNRLLHAAAAATATATAKYEEGNTACGKQVPCRRVKRSKEQDCTGVSGYSVKWNCSTVLG